jgi:hypothetical protein
LNGIATCAPEFHWNELGSGSSYCQTVSDGGASVVRPALFRSCSWPYRTVTLRENGGLFTVL